MMRALKFSTLSLLVLMVGGRISISAMGEGQGSAEKTAAQQYKNIQVLKDIPADELVPTMQFITASLGVECDFCHVEHDMDKDDKKPKKMAREMMRMMQAINQSNFSGKREVTCNTCHRGSIHPQAIPAIESGDRRTLSAEAGGTDESSADWPQGNSVVERYLEALGGRAALDKISARVESGKVLLGEGRELPVEVFSKSPDLRVVVMHTPNGDNITGYNGQTGWLAAPARPVREMSASEQYAARLDATVMFPTRLAGLFSELKLEPHSENVGDHAASVVWGISPGSPPVRFYFDPESGLLLRVLRYTNTALGLNPTQIDYADYRNVGGARTPFRWTVARSGGAFTIQLDQARDNPQIEPSRFEMPSTPSKDTAGEQPTH